MDVTHYEVLGIGPDADDETVRAAYRRRARETHPDVGGDHEDFVAVAAAWAVLSDPDARARYDAGLRGSDDDSWGEDVSLGARAPRPPSSRATESPARPAPEDSDLRTSRRRVLPTTAEELARLPHLDVGLPPVARTVLVTVLLAVATLFTVSLNRSLVAVDMVAAARTGVRPSDWSHLVFPLTYTALLVAAARHRVRAATGPQDGRGLAVFLLWACVAAFPLLVAGMTTSTLTGTRAPVPVVPTVLALAGTLAVALLAERTTRRTRRREAAVSAMYQRRRLAEAWDAFLAAQDEAGDTARAEHGVHGRDPRPTWALVRISDGALLASAPAGAPEAWAQTLRLAGEDASAGEGQD